MVAGPFAGLILADLGADVIKVENIEGGDVMRNSPAIKAAQFVYLNRNRKSLAIDLKSQEGKKIIYDLLRTTDVVIQNFGPRVLQRLGLSHDVVSKLNPTIIYCSIDGFGEGPYETRPATDPVIEAFCGLMSITGEPDRAPTRSGGAIIDQLGALYCVVSVMAALRARQATGKGDNIEVSLLETGVALLGYNFAAYSLYGVLPRRSGSSLPYFCPYRVFRTQSDQWIFLGVVSDKHWAGMCEALGVENEFMNKHATAAARVADRETVDKVVADLVSVLTRDEAISKLVAKGVPCAPVNSIVDVISDPHLNHRKTFADFKLDPRVSFAEEGQSAKCPLLPMRGSFYPPPFPDSWTAAPLLGENNAELLIELGYTEEDIAEMRRKKTIL